jgi:hypothetical protein
LTVPKVSEEVNKKTMDLMNDKAPYLEFFVLCVITLDATSSAGLSKTFEVESRCILHADRIINFARLLF